MTARLRWGMRGMVVWLWLVMSARGAGGSPWGPWGLLRGGGGGKTEGLPHCEGKNGVPRANATGQRCFSPNELVEALERGLGGGGLSPPKEPRQTKERREGESPPKPRAPHGEGRDFHPPKPVEGYAAEDWHARGGRTYTDIVMGRGQHKAETHHQPYFHTFNSPANDTCEERVGLDSSRAPSASREIAYESILRNLEMLLPKGNLTTEGAATAYTMKGRREYMEDTFSVRRPRAGQGARGEGEEPSLFGLFDGHGGCSATDYCRDNLLTRALEFIRGRGAGGSAVGSPRVGSPRSSTPRLSPREEDGGRREGVSLQWLKRAMRYAFSQVDRELKQLSIGGGTTGVCLAVSSSHLLVANAGDSRAVLWDVTGGARDVALSMDHKPSRRDEMRRIEQAGGFITQIGVPRVNGVLAVSRALGDEMMKKWVISEPEMRSVRRRPGQRFVVLATDGVWDVMTSNEVCLLIQAHWNDSDHGASAVAQRAFEKGSFDNITVLIVDLMSQFLAPIREADSSPVDEEEHEDEKWIEERWADFGDDDGPALKSGEDSPEGFERGTVVAPSLR